LPHEELQRRKLAQEVQRRRAAAPSAPDRVESRVLALQSTAGNRAVVGMLQRDPDTPTVTKPPVLDAPPTTRGGPEYMEDEDLAAGIIEAEAAVLDQWMYALLVFKAVLDASSDKSAKPDFGKAIQKYFEDLILDKLVEHSKIPGASTAFGAFKKVVEENERAKAAAVSASVRDFFDQHITLIAHLKKALALSKPGFVTGVEQEAQKQFSSREQDISDYGMLRMQLFESFVAAQSKLSSASREAFFRLLAEKWLQSQGEKAFIVIRVRADYSVKEAEIHGDGGQKIAEQLLKDSPGGVDVFGLRVERRILYFGQGGSWWSAMVRLDARGKLINTGALIEGDYGTVYRRLKAQGLGTTTKLSGGD
jgi:hypothetical protein